MWIEFKGERLCVCYVTFVLGVLVHSFVPTVIWSLLIFCVFSPIIWAQSAQTWRPHSPLSSLLMLFMSCGQSVVLEPKEVHGTGQLVLNVELLSLHNLSVLYLTFDSQNTCWPLLFKWPLNRITQGSNTKRQLTKPKFLIWVTNRADVKIQTSTPTITDWFI